MADLIKLWLYPNMTPRIWLSQIYLWKDKIMRYLFIFISLKYIYEKIRLWDNTWRDKIMRHLLMLICFKRCLIWNDPTARRKREEKASRIPRQKHLVSWIFTWNNSPRLFMMPRGHWDISSGFGTHIWWPYDHWMQDGRREKRWREALFHETIFYSSLRKNSDKMKQCVLFKAHVPNREKSLLTWTGASHIP